MTKETSTPAVKPVTILKGKEAIDAAIASIQTRGKRLDNDIQQAAVSCLAHHWADGDKSKGGDVTLINRLVAAMPAGSRVNALRDFIQTFGAVSYDEKSKLFVHQKDKPCDLSGAQATHWTTLKVEGPYIPFDALAAIKAMVKKLDNADPKKGDKVTPEQNRAIRDMAAALGV